ncbi:unnamed protein product [Chondrus crispus]|uniref:Uncharacterized protein n=1 Tax=Chondrus crispus TaxID=2769 RepID=R7Q3S4_CHOCR|nr:unnamed protein product [Chondrus crispus]CDF33187.1 unnamed protein product [Chondrus crispus]|eukprot:XP_005712990.1 unnamed protein product [Chondrus crispus]
MLCFISFLLCFLFPHSLARQQPALQFPNLNFDLPGTLLDTVCDSTGNLYALGQDSLATFLVKLSPSLDLRWRINIPSSPEIVPALAFDHAAGLFAAAAVAHTESVQTSESFIPADIVLYQINTSNGSLIASVLVKSAQILSGAHIQCISGTTSVIFSFIYVAFISLGTSGSEDASTRVVQLQKSSSGSLTSIWGQNLYTADYSATSFGIADTLQGEQIIVVALSRSRLAGVPHKLSAFILDSEGTISQKGSTAASSAQSKISNLAVDERGVLYVGESPRWLHRLALRSLNGAGFLVSLWNVSEINVVDMAVLNNGSAIYVLSKRESFRNDGAIVVRTKKAVLSVFNESGSLQSQYEHKDIIPDSSRELSSLKLTDPENSSSAVLGGSFQMPERERWISIGLFTFPKLVESNHNDKESLAPPAPDSSLPETSVSKGNSTLVVVGVSTGMAAFFVAVGVALLVLYRRGLGIKEDEDVSAGGGATNTQDETITQRPSGKEYLQHNNILV